MQLLHEHKDNHDQHFSEHQLKCQQFWVAPEIIGTSSNIDDLLEDVNKGEILQHLESIDTCYSDRRSLINLNTLDCITHAEDAGLFDVESSDPQYKDVDKTSVCTELVHSADLESTWKSEYDHWQDQWK